MVTRQLLPRSKLDAPLIGYIPLWIRGSVLRADKDFLLESIYPPNQTDSAIMTLCFDLASFNGALEVPTQHMVEAR